MLGRFKYCKALAITSSSATIVVGFDAIVQLSTHTLLSECQPMGILRLPAAAEMNKRGFL